MCIHLSPLHSYYLTAANYTPLCLPLRTFGTQYSGGGLAVRSTQRVGTQYAKLL